MSEFQPNSPFPTSNVNPFARYGYLPVSSTMSPQPSRRIWFILEGRPKPYSIISIDTNVELLKAAIQQRVKILRDIDADDLTLLKVVSLIPRVCAF